MTARKQKAARRLWIQPFQQEFAYSCVAAIVQTVYHYHTGNLLSHGEAIRLTGCKPDGAELCTAAIVLERLCRLRCRDVRTLAAAKKTLKSGMLVISDDNATWADPHAVLYCGATRAGVYVLDPNTAAIKWRRDKWVKQSGASEFIAIIPRTIQKSLKRSKRRPKAKT